MSAGLKRSSDYSLTYARFLEFTRYLPDVLDLMGYWRTSRAVFWRRHGTAFGPTFKGQDVPEEGIPFV